MLNLESGVTHNVDIIRCNLFKDCMCMMQREMLSGQMNQQNFIGGCPRLANNVEGSACHQ